MSNCCAYLSLVYSCLLLSDHGEFYMTFITCNICFVPGHYQPTIERAPASNHELVMQRVVAPFYSEAEGTIF